MERKDRPAPAVAAKPVRNFQSPSFVETIQNFEEILTRTVPFKPTKALHKTYKQVIPTLEAHYANASFHRKSDEHYYEDIDAWTQSTVNYSSRNENVENCPTYGRNDGNILGEKNEEMKISNPIEEILCIEKVYIKKLDFLIKNYMIPSQIMGEQVKFIFGNIEEIKDFHENIFYPELLRCNNDLIRIIECFSTYIAAGKFYIYVKYGLNQVRSKTERKKSNCEHFFKDLQQKINDNVGMDSLLLEPIQRIFKYKNIFESILKETSKKPMPNVVETTVAAVKAAHQCNEFLTNFNKAMTINDISNSTINLMSQGNFLNHYQVDIYDCNEKRKYKGNIFLFQQSIVCTERVTPTLHQFKCYFPNKTGHMECVSENKFVLSGVVNYKIEITGESTRAIQNLMEQIRVILHQEPSQAPNSDVNRYSSSSSTGSINFRNSGTESLRSNYESCLSFSDFSYVRDSGDFDTASTRGFIEHQIPRAVVVQQSTQMIEEMLINERNYVIELSTGIKSYVCEEGKQQNLGKILEVFEIMEQIRDYHRDSFYVFLENCKKDASQIATIFSKCAQEGQFNSYVLYSIKYSIIQPLLARKTSREYFENCQKETNENKECEYYLRLPLNRLGTYKYYLDRIISTLPIDTAKVAVSLCSRAINKLERIDKDIVNDNNTGRKKVTRKLTNFF